MTFLDAAHAAAAHVRAWPRDAVVRIVAHNDPDGVTAAAVTARWLAREKRKFHITFTWRRDAEFFESLERDPEDPLLLVDLGADGLGMLGQVADRGLVVDHHPPGDHEADRGWAHLNPWHEGLDGAQDACAATTALALAVAADEANWDLAPIALAGAVGDRQHEPEFTAWNAEVAKTAQGAGHVRPVMELAVDDDPLEDLLRWPPPILRTAAVDLTPQKLRLPARARPSELADEERQRLVSAIAVRTLANGGGPDEVRALLRPTFEADQLGGASLGAAAARLEAATRLGEAGVGLAWLLGDSEAAKELGALEERYHAKMHETFERIEQGAEDMGAYRVCRIDDVGILGAASSVAIGRVIPDDKPFLLEAESEGNIVVSARATPALVEDGIDLGRSLADAAEAAGGMGGGHAVAAGARVPAKNHDTFSKTMQSLLEGVAQETS